MQDIRALISIITAPGATITERHEAFAEIVARFQDIAYGCAYAVLSDSYLAEDAAQEAFITAWQKLPQLREPVAFPGWLRRLVLTQCNRLTRVKTFAEESERDPEATHKLHEFLNVVKAEDPRRQPFTPRTFESVVAWFERPDVFPDACFIAKDGKRGLRT